MNCLDRQFLSVYHSLHMHEARAVRPCDVLRPCGYVIQHLVMPHTGGYLRLLHRVHTAETAAFVYSLRLEYLYALHHLQ